MKALGVALILLGFVGLIFGGIHYHKKEEVARLGSLKMEVTEKRGFEIPPVLSGILILGGALLLFGARQRRGE